MALFRTRSFQGRIFVATLIVVLVPAGIAVTAGVVTLHSIGTRSGTLGAWDAVAETGRRLLGALDEVHVSDAAVRQAAERHRVALSESVRQSRVYVFVVEHFLKILLPIASLLTGILVTALALFTARRLSRGFGRPITELVGWTERIAHHESLPPEASDDGEDLEEFRALRRALRSMADDLQEGRRREVEAARMRSWSALARRVAHEIKNPLTPMRMAAATLTRDVTGPAAEAGRVLVEEIERLDDMARTFSQYGKMPEGPRSDVDLGELLRSLAAQFGTETVPVRVTCDRSTVVNAHYDALERAFRNLLVNAIEAQEGVSDGAVEIRIESEGDEAMIRVDDHGPGVPEDLLNEVWNPDVTTKRSGTGLGLAIVRQTVGVHDGSVEVGNRPGGGASFTVRLPAVRRHR